jgi:copper resistance protein D
LEELRVQRLDPGWQVAIALLLVLFLFYSRPAAGSQEHDTSNMKDVPGMQMADHGAAVESPGQIATLIADKRESEFNHHLAGFLILLAGLLILGQSRIAARWPSVRFVWPSCFLLAGSFLLLFSDTEMWPVGPQSPWFAITHNAEDLQHKIFSVILLVIGYIELQRARGRFKSPWFAWIFPVSGLGGAILLLFHEHGAGMHGPNHMAVMEHIQYQHRAFAATGAGIAVSKGLSEVNLSSRWFFSKLCPLLMIALGVLLMLYSE